MNINSTQAIVEEGERTSHSAYHAQFKGQLPPVEIIVGGLPCEAAGMKMRPAKRLDITSGEFVANLRAKGLSVTVMPNPFN